MLKPFEVRGFALNISEGGIRVAMDLPLPEDKPCVVQISPPEGGSYERHAQVVWSRQLKDGWLMGLRFDEKQ